MSAVDCPAVVLQMAFCCVQQVGGGHDTTREEIAGHPVFGAMGIKEVTVFAVCEDVYKQLAARLQPAVDALE